jgi:hypothetical protein
MLTVLECFRNFIKHNVSFHYFPTDFQGLSFTSPQAIQFRITLTISSNFPTFTALTIFTANSAQILSKFQHHKGKKPASVKLTQAFCLILCCV